MSPYQESCSGANRASSNAVAANMYTYTSKQALGLDSCLHEMPINQQIPRVLFSSLTGTLMMVLVLQELSMPRVPAGRLDFQDIKQLSRYLEQSWTQSMVNELWHMICTIMEDSFLPLVLHCAQFGVVRKRIL
ncbi:hypothetical protein M0804_000335 [Polistes exclamans]|nr:hypothetical protein M0804_000335 [Polistes exclamans]